MRETFGEAFGNLENLFRSLLSACLDPKGLRRILKITKFHAFELKRCGYLYHYFSITFDMSEYS